ncbi:adenylyl-sulfate kinase [Arcobacter sp. YIC-464]|uniref:adenylyl-sulfate kinase n=1 Tax=Arcobacter sp. YIC-464 TaxID=3376631 RepID=UPI003C1ADFF1
MLDIKPSKNLYIHKTCIKKIDREENLKQKPLIIWFTGLSASGKSTLANALEVKLFKKGFKTYLLDGDNLRHTLNSDLGFSDSDRIENIRRVSHLSQILVDSGLIVITAFISPFEKEREFARSLVKEDEFIEVFVDTPLEVCEKRDPKGLYKKARAGEVKNFTGVDSNYEVPKKPEIILRNLSIEDSVNKILEYLKNN